MLDNPWFTVNQRNVTSATGGNYGADRWYIALGGFAFDYASGATFTPGDAVLDQRMPELSRGTYTVSINIGGTIYSKTFTYTGASTNYESIGGGISFNIQVTSGYVALRLWNNIAQSPITVRAVKLERGTVGTLANDCAPNYATELVKCQRYYIRFSPNRSYIGIVNVVGNNVWTPLPFTKMKSINSIVNHGCNLYNIVANTQAEISAITFVNYSDTLTLDITISVSERSGTIYLLHNKDDINNYIEIIADL